MRVKQMDGYKKKTALLSVIALFVLLFAASVNAEFFLTSDASEDNASYFRLKINGVETEAIETKDYKLWYGLESIPVGRHQVFVAFGIIEDGYMVWSDWKRLILYKKKVINKAKYIKFTDGWYVGQRATVVFTLYYK